MYDIGGFFYRFWCMHMKKTNIGDKDRYVHKTGKELTQSMKDKIRSYELFLMAGGIAYGLMQCLVLAKPKAVWASFSGWLRTIRPDCSPSIKTCSKALQDGLFEFMMSNDVSPDLRKFYSSKYRTSRKLLAKTG